MWWWISAGYILVGVVLAGLCMGTLKGQTKNLSLPRFIAFLLLWPLLLLFFVVSALAGRKGINRTKL